MKSEQEKIFHIEILESKFRNIVSEAKKEIMDEIQAIYFCNNEWSKQNKNSSELQLYFIFLIITNILLFLSI